MNKLSCLIERFLFQVILLELLFVLVRVPVSWENFPLLRSQLEPLPPTVVIQRMPRFGWYLVGDCRQGAVEKGTYRIQSRSAGVCLEGPFSQLYRLKAQSGTHAPLKYGYWPLYIY